MKTRLILILAVLAFSTGTLMAASSPLGTAFTYQGRLNDGGQPANGSYDLTFTLWTLASGGSALGSLTNSATGVTNGLFTVTLDFGAGIFNGYARWLEIGVRTNGGGSFTALSPRQQLTPAPCALYAPTAGTATTANSVAAANVTGRLADAQLSTNAALLNSSPTFSGTVTAAGFTGNGAGLTNIGQAQLPAGVLTNNQSGVVLSGTFSGDGTGLTNVAGTVVWQTVTGTTQAAAPNTSYLLTNAAQTVVTLPTTATVGDTVCVSGVGTGGWAVVGGDIVGANGPAGVFWTARMTDASRSWNSVASSADGSKLVACVIGGQIYTSTDSGLTWTAQNSGSRTWQSVASSADGTKLVACGWGDYVYTSTDSGTHWTARMTDASRSWYSVASSADGSQLVAVESGGQIYTSTDSGMNWTARMTDASRSWYSVASSADGSKLVALVNGAQIYTSTDSGVTWTAQAAQLGNQSWTGVASSADGSKLVACTPGSTGRIYTSTDFGVTWTAQGISTNWDCVASSADGTKLVACVLRGQIYTSTDSGVTWTARMTDASRSWYSVASSADGSKLVACADQIYTSRAFLMGSQGATATLQYIGNGQWQPLNESQIAAGAVGSSQLASNLSVTGVLFGDGGGLTNLNASQLASGMVPLAQLPAGVLTNNASGVVLSGTFSGNGGGLTNLNASQLASGMVPLAQLPGGVLTNNASGVVLAGAFSGNGAGLTNLNVSAAQLTSIGNNNGGSYNFFVGPSGNSTTSGSDNTANGFEALYANTSGSDNTASGAKALHSNTTGFYNTANGYWALYANTNGIGNTADGFAALFSNTSGFDNTANGEAALQSNTSGSYNTADGVYALLNNTSGSGNIALGYQAGQNLTTGNNNICIGNPGVNGESGVIRIGTPGTHTNTFITGPVRVSGSTSGSILSGSNSYSTGVSGSGYYGVSGSGYYGVSGSGDFGVSGSGGIGVEGSSTNCYGFLGYGNGFLGQIGVYGSGADYAGFFDGWVEVVGSLSGDDADFTGQVSVGGDFYAYGNKNFKIDHPLDPANKYLLHSCIESPEVKNFYDGAVTTDAAGDATVTLPAYFEALNRQFRYQLTVIGQFAQAIVSEEIKSNRFSIKTDKPNVKVCWQVTGIRQDAYEKAHPMVVEQDKPAKDRGLYLHPELFGQPAEKKLRPRPPAKMAAPAPKPAEAPAPSSAPASASGQ